MASLTKLLLVLLTITYQISNISNIENFKTAIQIEQRNGMIIRTSNPCRIEYNIEDYRYSKDWLLNYYNHYQRTQNDSHRLRPCSKLTQFTISSRIPGRYVKYFHQAKYSIRSWSSANIELIQAITKVLILVILKIITKYYVRSYLKSYTQNKAINELIDLLSKAFTIAIAKIAIKWALYPALRTALKAMLIAGMKTLLKPFTKQIKKDKNELPTLMDKINRWILAIQIKTVIKTIALHLLWLVFENNHIDQSLHGIMFRVMVIITVKMIAKRICKMAKKKRKDKTNDQTDMEKTTSSTIKSNRPPVDEVLLFAIQKLVTKLIKLPLIKILF